MKTKYSSIRSKLAMYFPHANMNYSQLQVIESYRKLEILKFINNSLTAF